MSDPTVIYQVAVWDDNASPDHVALLADRGLAEAYQAKLPGAELDVVPIETDVPELVTVHYFSKHCSTRDGLSINGTGFGTGSPPQHTTNQRWSHEMRQARANWSHGDHHVQVVHYDAPELKLIEVTSLDEWTGRIVTTRTEERLKAEAAVGAIADGGSAGPDGPGRWLTPAEPEPPVGAIVENEAGVRWERRWHAAEGSGWINLPGNGPHLGTRSWRVLAGEYGPVRVVNDGG